MTEAKRRWLLAVLSCLAISIPFLLITFPPVSDLPQQVAQVRLFGDAISDPGSPYRIQWATPYAGVVALFGAIWMAVGPLATGRFGLLALGLFWVGAVHWLAARRQRPPEFAVLASLLFFNHSLYWGFANFLLGWPVFLLWFELTSHLPQRFGLRDAFVRFVVAILLYECHALWFAAGVGWLGLVLIMQRPPRRVWLWYVGLMLPLAGWAFWWWRSLSLGDYGYERVWAWQEKPWSRLAPGWWERATLFGLRGPVQSIVLAVIATWIVAALWTNRRRFRETLDRPMFLLAATLLIAVLVLPNNISFTVSVAERFAAPAVVALLLCLPSVVRGQRLWPIASMTLLVVYSGVTTNAWMKFDRIEAAGLSQAIEAVPPNSRVLGLDLLKNSAEVRGRPFQHFAVYSQVVKPTQLAFSFAEMPSSMVVMKDLRPTPWTPHLEWFSERVKRTDFSFFDYVIIGHEESRFSHVPPDWPLVPVTTEGRWRLFRVVR